MMDQLEVTISDRRVATARIADRKMSVAAWYNRKVRKRKFEEGDLVWKVIFPPGSRTAEYVK